MDSEKRREHAVALKYEAGSQAPTVVAVGAGELAKKILELAAENNVPIRRDDTLVDILSKINLGYEIPPETYRAVAEILAFLYRADQEWVSKHVGLEDKKLSEEKKQLPESNVP